MRIGILAEGWDYLLLKIFFARLAGIDESSLDVDRIDAALGWEQVLNATESALRRFYAKCCQAAILAIDNDGSLDLRASGAPEDPVRPRHWNHAPQRAGDCRLCALLERADRVRPSLSWLPEKPGSAWPIICTVPVEAIESWLLIARGEPYAEREWRGNQKQKLYGHPAATRDDVENVAVPIAREADLSILCQQSRSFALFSQCLKSCADQIRGPLDCWSEGDRASV